MSPTRSLRIAILTHSTNPRGGVVHALELGDALVRLGHEAVVHAPDAKGAGFFRKTLCEAVSVPASPAGGDVAEMVKARVADYLRYFERPANLRFDIFHAQDGLSGNALATLKERGLIGHYLQTVHHIDSFRDPELQALQARAIASADRHFTVSRLWRDRLADLFDVASEVVGNGVDARRFNNRSDRREADLKRRYQVGIGPIFLSIGGVEERKNTRRILEAFVRLRSRHPTAQLVIAGGASLLDHHAYRRSFDQTMAASGLPAGAVIETGPIADEDMPALYRIADALVFPSLKEGFGLVVLEAMASGIPVVVSRIEPFTEYLDDGDVAWCDPQDAVSIADAMSAVLDESLRHRLVEQGRKVTLRHDWQATAHAHVRVYDSLRDVHYA